MLAAATVALVVLLVGVWLAPRASGAAAAWMQTPQVRLHTLRVPGDKLPVTEPGARGAGAPVTLDAGMQFTTAGVVCDVPAAGAITIRLRTSIDGSAWGGWYEAPLEVVDEDGSVQAFTDPMWTGPARYVQVAASRSSGRGPAGLSGVRLVAIDPTEGAGVAARLSGGVRRLAATVAGIGVTQPAVAAASAPLIVTRAQWGADESLRGDAPSYASVKVAFVHHTASGNTYSPDDGPALVRAIYAYHTRSLGWSDIGYNFLVDRFGATYEGRYGGMDRGVIGAQVGGFNTGSTGVALIGTFSSEAPPAVAVTAVERLLAWKLSLNGLDPQGSAKLTCGLTDRYTQGQSVTFPVIAGHRQANYTECPGDACYALLPAMRAGIARRVGSAAVAKLAASSLLISPNGDGVLDTTVLDVRVSAPADWRLVVRAGGKTFATWRGQTTSAAVTWNGSSGGVRVADGVYTAELTATSSGSEPASASVRITVDTVAPRLNEASSTGTFSPDGDGQSDSAALAYSPAEACSVRVGILDARGGVVRWLHGWRPREARRYTVAWDGRVSSGGRIVAAPDGQYRFGVERRDAAGNIARKGLKISVDRTVGFPAAVPGTLSPNGDGVRDTAALGFKLTRKATVTVRVLLGSGVVRTLSLGTLAAGAHSAAWDGRAGSGAYLASSRPTFTVTAVSTLGKSRVTAELVVDLYRPRLYAAGPRTTSVGTATKLSLKVADPFSPKADVSYTITDAKGRRVASGHPGWRPTGSALSISWRPLSRGLYTVSYRAVDLGGNHEAATARTLVTVR